MRSVSDERGGLGKGQVDARCFTAAVGEDLENVGVPGPAGTTDRCSVREGDNPAVHAVGIPQYDPLYFESAQTGEVQDTIFGERHYLHPLPSPLDEGDVLSLFPLGDKALESAVMGALRTVGRDAACLQYQVLIRLSDLSDCIHDIAGCSPAALQFVECLDECINEARKHTHRILVAKGRAQATLEPLFEAARDGAGHCSCPSVGTGASCSESTEGGQL